MRRLAAALGVAALSIGLVTTAAAAASAKEVCTTSYKTVYKTERVVTYIIVHHKRIEVVTYEQVPVVIQVVTCVPAPKPTPTPTAYQLWEQQYGNAQQAAISAAVTAVLADANADFNDGGFPIGAQQVADLAVLDAAYLTAVAQPVAPTNNGIDTGGYTPGTDQQSDWTAGMNLIQSVANGNDNGYPAEVVSDLTAAVNDVAASGVEY
jgi:hypothetical protein